ncbi:hypothetical protein [Malacoplasma iowae]|uniref:hypothetical protein n=1 Tax=Malacoplasma iowae TaxID=2116 RepID=UPI002A18C801|nr:hypothetical protein [Malacoplasma iowae]WPL36540.1 hypothetical protein QX179_03895 [Malacoplasma iowae]WPL38292.1 hypothetical protein QX182_02100 [Malacoplasma iowae]WPL38693.1 hypothetical protein QX181_03950 [Malacoplasma iowae]WPL40278.1 hypothetical protein QX183_01840 [Malacoplasma iowae]
MKIIDLINATESTTNTIGIPLWLLILIGILVVISIIAGIYKIISYRKISIVSKKMDYLLEDLIYKSEFVTPTVEALVKLSSYVDLFEAVIKKNSDSLITYVSNNKEAVKKFQKKIKDVIATDKK